MATYSNEWDIFVENIYCQGLSWDFLGHTFFASCLANPRKTKVCERRRGVLRRRVEGQSPVKFCA